MRSVYFDTSVYSEIAKSTVPPEDEVALRHALAHGRIAARVSLANIDEIVAGTRTDRLAMLNKLKTARSLVGFHGMLKQPRDILDQAIRAYADGGEQPSITLPESEHRLIVGYLSEICAGSARHDDTLIQIVGDINILKDDWLTLMRKGAERARSDMRWDSRDPSDRRSLTFLTYWNAGAEQWAEDFAASVGCADACHKRGLDGLLALRPVRLCVGVVLSQIYEQVVGKPDQPHFRLANRNDGYDLWHAILASTADLFLTFDKRLADHVERGPAITGFRVVRSVRELLDAI